MAKILLADDDQKSDVIEYFPAQQNDFENILALLTETATDLLQRGIPQWSLPWDTLQLAAEMDSCRIAFACGNIVGVYYLKPLPDNNWMESDGSDLYLFRLAVAPQYQRMGIGVQMLAHAQRTADMQGRRLILDCWAGNLALHRFYEQSKMRYVADFPELDYRISVFCYDPFRVLCVE